MTNSGLPEWSLNAAKLFECLEATADVIVGTLDDSRLRLIHAGVPVVIVDELHAAAVDLCNRFAEATDSIEPEPAWLRSLIDGLDGEPR